MNRDDVESLGKAALIDLALRLSEQVDELARRLEALERRSVRGAAPFARPEDRRSASPKRPGRKGGHEGSFRRPPADEAVDERIEAPLTHCPRCGEGLPAQTDEVLEQTLIELPPVKAQVIRLVTHRNWCCGCGA